MADLKQKTKAFFERKADAAIEKIEKTPSKTLAVTTLLIITGGVAVLSYFQFQNNIRGPLMARELEEQKAKIYQDYKGFDLFNTEAILNSETFAGLQPTIDPNLDSDGDGLTDVMETGVYNTSAYLADSDSDGINDAAEIQAGTDPNCPEGQTCENQGEQTATATERVNTTDSGLTLPAGLDLSDPNAMMQYEMEMIRSGNFEALGITDPAQQVALKQYVEELDSSGSTIANTNSNSNTNTNTNTNSAPLNTMSPEQMKAYFSQMTPAQLRLMLKNQGYSTETLDKLSDAQLLEALQKSLEKL